MPSPSLSGRRSLLAMVVVASISTVATSKDNPFTWVGCQASPSLSPAPSPAQPTSASVNSTFRSYVVALLDELPSVAAPTGFASLSRGAGAGRAFVRGICRGDSASADCAAYLRTAAAGIRSRCNDTSRRAAIWYDKCSISYADTDVSTSHEDMFRQILYNEGQVSDMDAFQTAYSALMSRLAARVVDGSPTGTALFATGEAVYDSNALNGNMYGLLQCMRDRTAAECRQCLRDSVPRLPKCCYGHQGGVVLGYNCYLRVEIYTYYDLALDAPPPIALPPSSVVVREMHVEK